MRKEFLPFSLPTIGDEEIAEVVDTLKSGWITTGPKAKLFEERFARYVGSGQALAVSSCTAGLHLAMTVLGIGPKDEVIVPSMTFCSTINEIVHLGARPVMVEINDDFNISPHAIQAAISPRTKAILPVHYGGQACDLEAIYAIAARHSLAIVEDAAHAVGAEYRGVKIGSDALGEKAGRGQREDVIGDQSLVMSEARRSHAGRGQGIAPASPNSELRIENSTLRKPFPHVTVFSFYANKNMTTGEGGMITTVDEGLMEDMRVLSLHGMSRDAWKRHAGTGSWYYEVVSPGYKYNISDILAALGIHQIEKLDGFIESRTRIAKRYDKAFAGMPEMETPIVHKDRKHAYHLYVIRLNLDRLTIDRAQFIEELRARNIGSSVHFVPVHMHPFYKERYGYNSGDFSTTESLYQQIISLPLFPRMTNQDMDDVIAAVKDIVAKKNVESGNL